MEVTRETVNKIPHLITDYMYEGDNVGINLQLLNEAKTRKKIEVSGVPIDYSPVSINRTGNSINIIADLHYDLIDENINVVAEAVYPNNKVVHNRVIPDNIFANDMINTCLVEKKDIKNMSCYRDAFMDIVNTVTETALEENVLVKVPEFLYKCYVYSNDMELLGVAYRMIENEKGYILGEYVGKKLSEHMGRNIFIDLCINNDLTLQFANVKIDNAIDSSLSYALLDTSNAMIKRLTENYTDLNLKTPKKFRFPEQSKFKDINYYYEEMLKSNSPKDIESFFKMNKQKPNSLININKYLIG